MAADYKSPFLTTAIKYAWIPIPLFFSFIILSHLLGSEVSHPSATIQLIGNLLFTVLTSLVTIILLGRNFLATGSAGLLLIASGVLIWGGIGISGFFVKNYDINVIIIIYNSCIWLSALFFLTGGLLLNHKNNQINVTGKWLTIFYLSSALVVIFIIFSFLLKDLPLYYIQGAVGDLLRDLILGSSIIMLMINFVSLNSNRPLPLFNRWFALSIALLGVGLFGFILEKAHSDIVSWAARAAQYLAGIYMFIAAVVSDRDLRLWKTSMKAVLKQSIEAKLRAEASDRSKSSFLANMSHELRSPLNSIIGFTGILLKEMPGKLNEEQKKQLKIVQSSGFHLLSLINDILDISKIEAGQMSIEYEKFDFEELLQQTIVMLEPQIDTKNLVINRTGDKIGEFESDRKKLQQVILNILNNAVKFTEQGSITIDCRRENHSLRISIQDTGIGIKKEDLVRLFDPFSQIDSELTRKYKGSGLGLSICLKLTQLLGGSISAESEFGKGSTFSIELPLSKKDRI